MSVKNALLALLAEGEQYGYELRAAFEQRTGGTWPLNIGQIYTTLDRLERDGLVERRDADSEGRVNYALTPVGRDEAAAWWSTPEVREGPGRDDMAMKMVLAASTPGVDVAAVIQAQRKATMTTLQDLTRAKRASTDRSDAWELVADAMIFRAEADVRWLDHIESRLEQRARGVRARKPGEAATPVEAPEQASR